MGAPRRKQLIKSRKRLEDEGEEEEGSVAQALEEDSLSEASIVSDADDDADGEGSDDSETDPPIRESSLSNGHKHKGVVLTEQQTSETKKSSLLATTGDTEAMMNGLNITNDVAMEEVNFDEMAAETQVDAPLEGLSTPSQGNTVDKRRTDHEEYKRRRDADPAFVPNRGGFFMHDHRSAAPGQNGFRPFARGAAKAREGVRGPFLASNYFQPPGPADSPWAHDLHESVAAPDLKHSATRLSEAKVQGQQHGPTSGTNSQPPNRSFSRTIRLGDMQVRILLQGMSEPIIFSGVARNSHTRLPHHRPPLRRDKPVRISIPEMSIRYIFPSMDRSFIFIPRALRPNQQGFGRTRGRGSFGPGYGSFGQLSSRRTSVYAGSAYSPSVAMSRRSSIAREVSAVGIPSPSQAKPTQQTAMSLDAGKPVVRLPPAAEQQQQQASGVSTVNMPRPPTYPLPQKPTFHENRPEDLPMHHPKPERSLQVADIESPAAMEFNPPASHQQPFHQQVPLQFASQPYQSGTLQFPHSRHPSQPSQASAGTPLPQIPETAIHAQPFQPYSYPPAQSFYPQPYPPTMYYYPPLSQGTSSPAAAQSFVPGQQYFYPMAIPAAPPQPQPPPPPPPPQAEQNTQPGTVAHEASGMVYYYDPSELAAMAETTAAYTPTYSSAPPSGMEGMMHTSFYPQTHVYYPPPQ